MTEHSFVTTRKLITSATTPKELRFILESLHGVQGINQDQRVHLTDIARGRIAYLEKEAA